MSDATEQSGDQFATIPAPLLGCGGDEPELEVQIKAAVMEGEGEMPAIMRAFNWSTSPLGPVSGWPQSLRTALSICLNSRFPIVIWWGPELVLLYNDSWHPIVGNKHPKMLGRPGHEHFQETWTVIGPMLKGVLDSGRATYSEDQLLFIEKRGIVQECYYTWSYSPIRSEDGEVGGVFTAVTETTSRVIGERRLKTLRDLGTVAAALEATEEEACENAVRRLGGNSSDIPFALIYLIDENGTEARLKGSAGIEPGALDAPMQVTSDDQNSRWPVFHVCSSRDAQQVDAFPLEFSQAKIDSEEPEPTTAYVIPILSGGQCAAVLVVGLSRRLEFNQEYREFLHTAASHISTAITNARSYQAERKRAEALAELDRAKTAFFSNISHEFRTPLTLMLGPIESALNRNDLTGNELEELQLLHRNALRLLKMVNALLDFSRIEAGRLDARFEPVDLAAYTADLVSVFRSAAHRAGVELTVNCPPTIEPAWVDRFMWEKIVLNLVSNALKSTFEGRISVELASVNGEFELSVSDTGTGISASELPHLFERFRRVEGARRRTNEGSGIGLALVNELVEIHVGTITVESDLGTGSTFRVRIPSGHSHLPPGKVIHAGSAGLKPAISEVAEQYLHEALGWIENNPEAELHTDEHQTADTALSANLRKDAATILLVDDNRDMRSYVRRLLSDRYQVITAENGMAAWTRLEEGVQPDLVLTDVMMPEMDGFELLAAIRADTRTASVPVIMLSARAGEESRIEGLQSGADDYLVKPFTARELLARVDSHLRMAEFRREAQKHESELVKSLSEARRMAADAIELISDGFYTYDAQWRLTYMNAAAESQARGSKEALIGRTVWESYPEVIGTELESHFRLAMETQTPTEFQYHYRPWSRWFSHRLYPAPDGGLTVYVRDITESKSAEQALRRADQLATAGRLAASIAHEVNNPLEAVTNLLYLAANTPELPEQASKMLSMADRELRRLSQIASTGLRFYRQSSAPSRISIQEMIDSVLFFNEAKFRTLKMDVQKQFFGDPFIECFPGEIQQVLANLVGNAIDATTEGGSIYVRARSTHLALSGEEAVRITIADTGHGMEDHTKQHLFDAFFTTKQETGTGLGLWVSKGIIEKHRGTIIARSRRGVGTVFSVVLPRWIEQKAM